MRRDEMRQQRKGGAPLLDRVTGAQGADRTGLGTLIEMTATSGAADAFVTVALAGTIFFSTSVDQARGKVVLLNFCGLPTGGYANAVSRFGGGSTLEEPFVVYFPQ